MPSTGPSPEPSPAFTRYVALGDSFTEGVGDPDPSRPNGVRGWADRVAEVLAAKDPEFGYANLAIRGRKIDGVIADQIDAAVALEPDLVSVYAGGNDLMRPAVDIDGIVDRYAAAIQRLAETGAHIVLFTGFDPGGSAVFNTIRGRFATYNELVRELADRHNATLVDFWRMRDYRDWRYWAVDRIHMSTPGHQRMAISVLDALGVPHDLEPFELPSEQHLTRRERLQQDLEWARTHAAPWVHRRLTGRSSGDGLQPRHPTLARVG